MAAFLLGSIADETGMNEPPGDPKILLDNLPGALLLVDEADQFAYLNVAAEQLLGSSRNQLAGRPLAEQFGDDAVFLDLLAQVRRRGISVSDHGMQLALRRGVTMAVDAHLAPVVEAPGSVVALLNRRSHAERIDLELMQRTAGRSAAALASTLAHEVRNPLSGIRGAAQLLESSVEEEDRPLLSLIVDETDRICRLLDSMEAFADMGPLRRGAVNIHLVLEHVRRVAESGFARHLAIEEAYDPSLPAVDGDRDRLVQLFLNLLKNAAEAAPRRGGRIRISTHYQHGLRIAEAAGRQRRELPITVEIRDNGPGVPPELVDCLFDPFVSGRAQGKGLGLALVAKIATDHGGVVSYVPGEPGAIFRVRLPAVREFGGETLR